MREASMNQPVIVGEVLFDHFPDGSRVLGGAPFNVAWNLQGLGMSPHLVTCIGDDDDGQAIQKRMDTWGLTRQALQISPSRPTSKVAVEIHGGQPSYDIVDQQSFDQIVAPSRDLLPSGDELIYTGTLALRHQPARNSVSQLLSEDARKVFIDANIRQPWFDFDWASQLFAKADWVKLSEGELGYLTDPNWSDRELAQTEIVAGVRQLRKRISGGRPSTVYFVTLGHRGCCAITPDDELIWADPCKPAGVMQDTVGAGDAFVAATIYGLSHEWAVDRTLQFASRFAAQACTLHGATTDDKQHYQAALN